MKSGKYYHMVRGFIILTVLFFSGCMMVGPDFTAPEVETPETYRHAAEDAQTMTDLKWWELFNDPVLYKLVQTALENNRNLKIALSRIEEARAEVGYYKADEYPRLDADGGASTGNFSGSRSDDTVSNVYIAPMLSWEIDFWGKYRRSTEAARAQLTASEFALRTVQIGLISDVVTTYYQLLDYQQRLDISKYTLVSRKKSLNIIRQRFRRGIIPEIDLNQAQIQKEIAAAAIPRHERLIAKTENALNILLGQLPSEIKSGEPLDRQTSPPYIPNRMPSQLIERRPDISEALALLKAQNAQIGAAEAQRFPSISLTGVLGYASSDLSAYTSSGEAWSVSAGLFGPIYDFNKNIRRVDIEKEQTKQALYRYENTVLTAFREVEDALVEIQTFRRELTSVRKKVKAAKNANQLSIERYDKGVSSYLEVLETERTLFDVKLELSELKQNYFNAYVKLYKALGGGWVSKEEMTAQSQPES